jgi:hypothetical protein
VGAYKLDVRKQYGQFQHRVYAQGSAAPEHQGGAGNVKEMISAVEAALDGSATGKGDLIIFRNISYEDRSDLMLAIRDAPY